MAYATTNPPVLRSQPIAGRRIWDYLSADAAALVQVDDYFTNGYDLGMRLNDLVYVTDSDNGTTDAMVVRAASPTVAVDLSDATVHTVTTNTD